MISLSGDALRGSYPPVATPFKDGRVDFDAYASLVEAQILGGSHGILVNGTTAEPSSLTIAERNQLLAVAVETAAGRIPVVAATGSQSLAETLELTRHADELGVQGVLVVTPYYIRPPQRGLVAYFQQVAAVTRAPLLMYHIPGRAAVTVELDTLQRLADSIPHFVGMKHASADLSLITECRRTLSRDFRIFAGLEDLSFPMLCVGASGLMNAVGNLCPGKVAALCAAVFSGDLGTARRLHDELWPLNKAIFFDTNPIPLKYLMRSRGLLQSDEVRLPLSRATPEVAGRLDHVLSDSAAVLN